MIHRYRPFRAAPALSGVCMVTLLIVIAGAWSFQHMPVDAYPDLSPPMVELITQWPGHAAEEVERLTTLPLELAMNGTPNLHVMRSISLYGLSDVILTFDEGTDPLFRAPARFSNASRRHAAQGVTPSMAPLFSPSGLVYRYVIESPDRTPQELHTYRRLDYRTRLSQRSRCGRRLRLRRPDDGIPRSARSRASLQLPHPRRAGR